MATDLVFADCKFLGTSSKIRIVKLRPGKWDDALECDMSTHDLHPYPQTPYIALSYVWGLSKACYPLKINQREINIKENLYNAMRYLRSESSETVLWVDALCINQGDILERTQQVKQMGTVYKKAKKVLAWLGNPADSSDEVMRYLASTGSRELNLEHSSEFSHCFDRFCSRQYWTRVWVIQEVVLAKELVLKCGDEEVDGRTAIATMAQRFKDRHHTMQPEAPFWNIFNIATHLSKYQAGQLSKEDPLHTLKRAAPLKATNPLDKIYGLLELLPRRLRKLCPPQYDITFDCLMRDLVKAYSEVYGRLDILCEFQPRYCSEPGSSWLPDIGKTWRDMDLVNRKSIGSNASTTIKAWTLGARGVEVSRITTVLGPLENRENILLENFKNRGRFLTPDASFTLIKETTTQLRAEHPEKFDAGFEENLFRMLGGNRHVMAAQNYGKQPGNRHQYLSSQLWDAAMTTEHERNLERFTLFARHFEDRFGRLRDRSFFTTDKGQVGLGPTNLKPGDLICALFGCRMPVALRERQKQRHSTGPLYQFVGPVCPHDIQDTDYTLGVEEVAFEIY